MLRKIVGRLASWRRMEVEDSVNVVFRTKFNHSIKVLEAGFLENSRVHIVCQKELTNYLWMWRFRTFEVVVVEGKANAVQAESAEELGIGIHEKVLEELGRQSTSESG